MQRILTIICLYLVTQFCSSCSASSQEDIAVKKYTEIEFSISNENVDSIGYEQWKQDEDIGVKSLCLYGDYIYLVDVYHSNIKRVNIKDKSVLSSVCLSSLSPSNSGIWLRDIVVFNEKVYVTGDRDSVYVFTTDLKYQGTIKTKRGQKTIFGVSNDSLLIYQGEEQLPDKDVKYDLLLITNKKATTSEINKTISIEEFERKNTLTETLGKAYRLYSEKGKNFIEMEQGTVELRKPVPSIVGYSARNIDFTSKYLVYFNSTSVKLTLYIYELDTPRSRK